MASGATNQKVAFARQLGETSPVEWRRKIFRCDLGSSELVLTKRRPCRPKTRWIDDFTTFFKNNADKLEQEARFTLQKALDTDALPFFLLFFSQTPAWAQLESNFVQYAH